MKRLKQSKMRSNNSFCGILIVLLSRTRETFGFPVSCKIRVSELNDRTVGRWTHDERGTVDSKLRLEERIGAPLDAFDAAPGLLCQYLQLGDAPVLFVLHRYCMILASNLASQARLFCDGQRLLAYILSWTSSILGMDLRAYG